MKDFFHRHVTLISSLLGFAFLTVFLLFVFLIAARENKEQTSILKQRLDQPESYADLPGPKNQLSDRSKKEILTLLQTNPNIVGAWAAKIKYEKTENPVFFYFANDPIVDTAMANYDAMQKSGRGYSSAELDAASPQSAANTEEAKIGIIKCGPLSSTNIGKLAPGIDSRAKGVCRATIPPFDDNVNLAIVVLIDSPGDMSNPEVIAIRRLMLQLQIDIFNRDFQGRETWIHP